MKRAIIALILTAGIFVTGFATSNYMSNIKLNQLKVTSDTLSTDILSLETQFALLSEASCKTVNGSTLSDELNALGERLSYAETQQSIDRAEVLTLKKYYSILQIKDFLLMKRLSTTCPQSPITILYFYSSADQCKDCNAQSITLSKLRQDAPEIRVYSFDYDMDLSVLQTLISLYKIEKPLPALIINETLYQGYQDRDTLLAKNIKIKKLIDSKIKDLKLEQATNSSASTSGSR